MYPQLNHVWGTNDERTKNREKAFAMQGYFGLPSLFDTWAGLIRTAF